MHWSKTRDKDIGGYWSVTKYNDIMAVDTNHELLSSEPAIIPRESVAIFSVVTPPGPRKPRNRRHGETRQLILDAAQRLVQTESYDGFSFRDVAKAVGIRKASVYHHFETKGSLVSAMADRARERFREWAANEAPQSPLKRLDAYCLDFYGKHLGAGERLCPAWSLVSGWSHLPVEVQRAALALRDRHQMFLEAALKQGAAVGELRLPPGCDAAQAARWFVSAVQGALIVSRSAGGHDAFVELCNIALAVLRAPAEEPG